MTFIFHCRLRLEKKKNFLHQACPYAHATETFLRLPCHKRAARCHYFESAHCNTFLFHHIPKTQKNLSWQQAHTLYISQVLHGVVLYDNHVQKMMRRLPPPPYYLNLNGLEKQKRLQPFHWSPPILYATRQNTLCPYLPCSCAFFHPQSPLSSDIHEQTHAKTHIQAMHSITQKQTGLSSVIHAFQILMAIQPNSAQTVYIY